MAKEFWKGTAMM